MHKLQKEVGEPEANDDNQTGGSENKNYNQWLKDNSQLDGMLGYRRTSG